MTAVQIINATLQIWGSLISILIAVCLYYAGRFRIPSGRIYLVMLMLNTGSMLFDVLALFLRGNSGQIVTFLLWFANTASFACNVLLLPTFIHYLLVYLKDRKAKVNYIPMVLVSAVSGVLILALIINLFHPFVFGIDGDNLYYRDSFFWIISAGGIVGMLSAVYLIVKHRRDLTPTERLALSCYIAIPFIAIPLQVLLYGLALINIGNTLSLTLIYLVLQVHQARRIAQQENALIQSRYTTALSQIQPHFIFNALNAIQYLCKTDPEKASFAVGCFAKYLRVNMESLSCSAPVPLSEDIAHLENYISIERLRFPDIRFEFDLQSTCFKIPALTLQPLVENAIKHGVRQLSEGGVITISSWEGRRFYYLEIKDNGGGFPEAGVEIDDSQTHLGIPNTRTRIELMCHGKMHVENHPGEGVTVRIQIPKEKV